MVFRHAERGIYFLAMPSRIHWPFILCQPFGNGSSGGHALHMNCKLAAVMIFVVFVGSISDADDAAMVTGAFC